MASCSSRNKHRAYGLCNPFFSCLLSCKAAETSLTCGCLDYNLEQGDDYLTLMAGMDHVEEIIGAYDESTKREVVGIICSAHVADGDHLQVRHKLGFRCTLPRRRTLRRTYREKNRSRFTEVLVPRFFTNKEYAKTRFCAEKLLSP